MKAPSKHGLDRKYKPWRKGKSQKAKKQVSLKHQLRGQERLMKKVQREPENESTKKKVEELQGSIESLKEQIAAKERQEQERQHAKKSHGTRFLERQRLTRLERNARKKKDKTELEKIAMDQIYVAHYPLLKKYKPLFQHGERYLQNAVSRAEIRQKIVNDLHENKVERVPWISKDQYERIPSEWSLDTEKKLFGYPTFEEIKKKKATNTDDRFTMESKHEAVLEVADKLESELAKAEPKEDKKEDATKEKDSEHDSDIDESSSSSDDDDGADPMNWNAKQDNDEKKHAIDQKKRTNLDRDNDVESVGSSSSSDSDSEDSDSDDDTDYHKKESTENKGKSHEEENNRQADDESDDDDFLVPAKEDDLQIFEKIQNDRKHHLPAENPARGDKSQGWATQQQRPGKFKKKRVRR